MIHLLYITFLMIKADDPFIVYRFVDFKADDTFSAYWFFDVKGG